MNGVSRGGYYNNSANKVRSGGMNTNSRGYVHSGIGFR